MPCLRKAVQQEALAPFVFPDTSELQGMDIDGDEDIDTLEVDPDLLSSLTGTPDFAESFPKTEEAAPPNSYDAIVLDGMAVLHFFSPQGSLTFEDFANKVFLP